MLGRPAFMTKILFFSMIATFGIAIFYFNIIRLLLLVLLIRISLNMNDSMQHLRNYVDRKNMNYFGKKCGPEEFVHHKSYKDWNEKDIIRSKSNQTTV
jgi:hypothetical protein